MKLKVYLSGEIHTNWRDELINKCRSKNLEIEFSSPNTNHELSDDVGVKILTTSSTFFVTARAAASTSFKAC